VTKSPKAGDHVSWKSHGGQADGTVVKKVTKPLHIKGHKVAASRDNPEFIVETRGATALRISLRLSPSRNPERAKS
jgi:hypothetical protein